MGSRTAAAISAIPTDPVGGEVIRKITHIEDVQKDGTTEIEGH